MQRKLVKILAIPLGVAVVLSLVISHYWEAEGFFVNLATELIGIVLTVFYVDLVLARHSEREWKPVVWSVSKELRVFSEAGVKDLQRVLRIGHDKVADIAIDPRFAPELTYADRLARGMTQAIFDGVPNLPPDAWPDLIAAARNLTTQAAALVNVHGRVLPPAQYANLVTIQSSLGDLVRDYDQQPLLYTSRADAAASADKDIRNHTMWWAANNIQRASVQMAELNISALVRMTAA